MKKRKLIRKWFNSLFSSHLFNSEPHSCYSILRVFFWYKIFSFASLWRKFFSINLWTLKSTTYLSQITILFDLVFSSSLCSSCLVLSDSVRFLSSFLFLFSTLICFVFCFLLVLSLSKILESQLHDSFKLVLFVSCSDSYALHFHFHFQQYVYLFPFLSSSILTLLSHPISIQFNQI